MSPLDTQTIAYEPAQPVIQYHRRPRGRMPHGLGAASPGSRVVEGVSCIFLHAKGAECILGSRCVLIHFALLP